MLLVNLLDKDRSNKEEEKDIADPPWLTDSDLVQIQQELPFLRQQRADGSKKSQYGLELMSQTDTKVMVTVRSM